jgi:5-methylcytosine-specific restriction endonuclease McrA
MNREENKKYMKKWHKEHPEYNKQYYKESSEWKTNNLEHCKKYMKQWREKNSNYMKEYRKQYNFNNAKRIKVYMKQWRGDNTKKIRIYENQWRENRYKTDLKFNLNIKMSRGINSSIKNNKNGRHWETFLNYTLKDLIKRLTKTMPEGYNWQDYLNGELEIDHIIPKSKFNFTKPEHPDFKRCWALNNLQLLPMRENRIKSDKLTRPFQLALKM